MRPPGLLNATPALNRALVEAWTEAEGPLALASPLTGSGLTVEASVAARLRSHDDRAEFLAGIDLLLAGIAPAK